MLDEMIRGERAVEPGRIGQAAGLWTEPKVPANP
jgi:hypothetical protein